MSKKRRRSAKREFRGKVPASGHLAETRIAEIRESAARGLGSRPLDNWLFGLALAGIVLTTYLTFTAWFGEKPVLCGAGSQCDLVQQSRWSTLLGVPIAFWGLLTYGLLARLVWRLRSRPSAWRATLFVSVVGAAVSWYLTAVSMFAIEALCAYCLASFAIANILLIMLLLRRPAHMPEHAWSNALPVPLISAILIVSVLSLHFSGLFDPASGPEKPYLKALATHLRDSGARLYGTYWCPVCQQQKALFEASADRLPYVECTPEGRDRPLSFTCVANNITDYPTWIIHGHRQTGVVTVEELARLSGFEAPPDAARSK